MPYKTPEDIREYHRSYYQRNRERLLKKQAEKNKRILKSRREWLIELKKSLKCTRCDGSHPATLTFHHKTGVVKSFEIGSTSRFKVSLKRLQEEIEKCEVLCANCHAKEHWAYLFE